MSKTSKIYLVFFLIFIVGFTGIYLYIKLFLNQQLTTTGPELKEPVGALLGFL